MKSNLVSFMSLSFVILSMNASMSFAIHDGFQNSPNQSVFQRFRKNVIGNSNYHAKAILLKGLQEQHTIAVVISTLDPEPQTPKQAQTSKQAYASLVAKGYKKEIDQATSKLKSLYGVAIQDGFKDSSNQSVFQRFLKNVVLKSNYRAKVDELKALQELHAIAIEISNPDPKPQTSKQAYASLAAKGYKTEIDQLTAQLKSLYGVELSGVQLKADAGQSTDRTIDTAPAVTIPEATVVKENSSNSTSIKTASLSGR